MHKHTVPETMPWSAYIRLFANFIMSTRGYETTDILELTRQYELAKVPGSTEKQVNSRARTFITNFLSKQYLDFATFTTFLKVIKTKRIKIELTLYAEDDTSETYLIETTLEQDNATPNNNP